MSSSPSAPARRPLGGRPRDPQIDRAVLRAVRELLAEDGYGRLSFETVARRAGVTRPTIYRRWPSKAHLVHDAVFPSRETEVLIRDSGDFAADVRQVIADTVASYSRPEARAALPGLFTDLYPDPRLRADVVQRLEQQAREQFRLLVERARARGAVRTGADADVLFDTLTGAIFARVVTHGSVSAGFAESLAATVLDGTATGCEDAQC